MASQASARGAATAALRHTEMGAHERKYQSCEVRIHSFHKAIDPLRRFSFE
jgi:hypothetical protein